MHARLLRSRRLPLLAILLAGSFAFSACSEQAADATSGQQASTAPAPTNQTKPTSDDAASKGASNLAAGPAMGEKEARKPVDDPKADAAAKEAYARGKQDPAAGAIDREDFKTEM